MSQEQHAQKTHERETVSQLVIFTDLDGTLLDHASYSFDQAVPALKTVKETQTPLVFVTSKTEAEVKAIQEAMGIWGSQPFVVENGGAIFLPQTFPVSDMATDKPTTSKDGFTVIELGRPYGGVREVLADVVETAGIKVKTIGDMSVEEFAEETGLSLEKAKLAKKRSYQEGFLLVDPEGMPDEDRKAWKKEAEEKLQEAITEKGYKFSVGGRFYQIAGKEGGKINAVRLLQAILTQRFGRVYTVALGDAQSDLEMLEACDLGILVGNPKKTVDIEASEKIAQMSEIGPEAWNKAVLALFDTAS